MVWLGIPFVAQLLGVSEGVVRKWIRDGRLRAIRAGGKLLRVEEKELRRFLDECRIPPDKRNTGGRSA